VRAGQAAAPGLHHRQAAHHLGLEEAGDLLGVADGFVEHVAHDGGAHGQQSGEQERQHHVERHVGEDRLVGGAGGIGNADGAVLESGVDAGFLDFADQFLVEGLIGVGFALEGLVLEAVRVEAVELGLGFGHGLLQHGLAVDGFAVLDFDAQGGVLARVAQLALDLFDLNGGLAVLGVVGAVVRLDVLELSGGLRPAWRRASSGSRPAWKPGRIRASRFGRISRRIPCGRGRSGRWCTRC
jgi:hypothetical protein